MLNMGRISEGGTTAQERSPVTLKLLPSVSLVCVYSLQYCFMWAELENIHYLSSKHLALFPHPGIVSLSSFICCPNIHKWPVLELNWYCKSSEPTFPSTRTFLPQPSGNPGREHDVLGVVFHIVLFCFQIFIHLGNIGVECWKDICSAELVPGFWDRTFFFRSLFTFSW